MDDICFDKCMRCDAVIVSDATAVAALKADNEKLRAVVESRNVQFQRYARNMEKELNEAADELERLTSENEKLRAALRDVLSYVSPGFPIPVTIYDNARAALQQEVK